MGKKTARVIYELLGPEPALERLPWIESFARGLDAFRAGDFTAAEAAMRETIMTRGADGPSSFYLEQIAALRDSAPPPDWNGIVELSAK